MSAIIPTSSIIERSSASLEGGIARASTTISSGRWKPKRPAGVCSFINFAIFEQFATE